MSDSPPRVSLILAPTPLHRLDVLSERLNLDLWMKRDDLTGFALGGNKGRKLEYLIADALAKKADVVVTCGAAQSNFVRQLGAACSKFGLRCAAAVMELPFSAPQGRPETPALSGENGNALLDRILDVDLRVWPDGTWEHLYEHAEALAVEFESQGQKVYRVPVGGSSALSAYAFLEAAREIERQAAAFDWIVFASSSGSTHTGLAYALQGTPTKVLGICSDPEPELVEDFAKLSTQLDELLGENRALKPEQFLLNLDFVGPGYGVPSEAGNEAIRLVAQKEGIFLDPIYTGKAFAALTSLAERMQISGRVLFWHTGGIPALFA